MTRREFDIELPTPASNRLGLVWLNEAVNGDVVIEDDSLKVLSLIYVEEVSMNLAIIECDYFDEIPENGNVPEYEPKIVVEKGGMRVIYCKKTATGGETHGQVLY